MQQYTPKQLNKPSSGSIGSQQVQKNLTPSYEALSKKGEVEDLAVRYGHLEAVPMIYSCGQPVPLPITFVGDDGDTYILDQVQDAVTGVYSLCVFKKNGPYSYQQVYKGDGFKAKNDDSYGTQSNLVVDQYVSPDNSTKVLSNDDLTSLSSEFNKMNLGFSMGDLLKQAPSILGHVIEIGTTIAGLVGEEYQASNKTVIKNPIVKQPVNGPIGYYSIGTNTTSGNATGLNVSTYATSNVEKFMASKNKDPNLLIPFTKYVIPLIKWAL